MNPVRRVGKRYPLMLYTRMLDRWWPALLLIGIGTAASAWSLYHEEFTRLTQPLQWRLLAGAGALGIGLGLLLLLLRKSAYVQPFSDHLRLVTPFFRMKISYRRFVRTTTTAMGTLFPPRGLRGLNRDILEPLLANTAVVVEFNSLPLSIRALKLFLSPFFFKDATPHLVIVVKDWMGFTMELNSLHAGLWAPEARPPTQGPSSILSKL
jgi:hypothetical protein